MIFLLKLFCPKIPHLNILIPVYICFSAYQILELVTLLWAFMALSHLVQTIADSKCLVSWHIHCHPFCLVVSKFMSGGWQQFPCFHNYTVDFLLALCLFFLSAMC